MLSGPDTLTLADCVGNPGVVKNLRTGPKNKLLRGRFISFDVPRDHAPAPGSLPLPEAFRRMALERLKNCASVSALAEELRVHRAVLYHWQRQAGEQGTEATATSPVRELRKHVRDLTGCGKTGFELNGTTRSGWLLL